MATVENLTGVLQGWFSGEDADWLAPKVKDRRHAERLVEQGRVGDGANVWKERNVRFPAKLILSFFKKGDITEQTGLMDWFLDYERTHLLPNEKPVRAAPLSKRYRTLSEAEERYQALTEEQKAKYREKAAVWLSRDVRRLELCAGMSCTTIAELLAASFYAKDLS